MSSGETTIPQPVNYIADAWSDCETIQGEWNVDPNTREPVHRMVTTGSEDIERALQHAERVYSVGRWDDDARQERADVLERVAALIETRVEDIARADALTSGVPIGVTRKVAAFLPARIRATAADLRRRTVAMSACTRSRGGRPRSSRRGTARASFPRRRS